jgi:hypothetical protein
VSDKHQYGGTLDLVCVVNNGIGEKLGKLHVGQRYAGEVETREWRGRPIRKITKAQPADHRATPGKPLADEPASPAKPSLAEPAFVARVLGAGIISGQVKFDPAELTRATQSFAGAGILRSRRLKASPGRV